MELLITGKHYEIENEDRELARTLSDKLAADYGKLNTLRLVLTSERNWFIADALLNGKSVNLNAKAKSTSMPASISGAIEKLDKQMRRYLDRVRDLAVKPDPEVKEKIWTSEELALDEDNADLAE